MRLLQQLLIIVLLFAGPLNCRGYKYIVDSFDAKAKIRVRVIAQKMGDKNYQRYGPLLIHRRGKRYYLSFPLLQYINTNQDNVMLPEGSLIKFECGHNKAVTTSTKYDNHVLWYCHWYKYPYLSQNGNPYGGIILTSSHNSFNFSPDYMSSEYDVYAFNWNVRTELTRDDMVLLSRRKITEAYVMRNGTKIVIPISNKQARKIQQAVSALLHTT